MAGLLALDRAYCVQRFDSQWELAPVYALCGDLVVVVLVCCFAAVWGRRPDRLLLCCGALLVAGIVPLPRAIDLWSRGWLWQSAQQYSLSAVVLGLTLACFVVAFMHTIQPAQRSENA